MSTIKANTLTVKCGSTLTLGESGKTVSIASGASTSGMGRSGTVDWQTSSIKTATFTAVNGQGFFCNTSGGAFTVNLPAGSAGAIVSLSDYTRTFATNNLTITPNGSEKIGGEAFSATLNVNGQAITLVYVDGTEGWINIQNAEDTETGVAPFMLATGGTITTSSNDKIHTFTSPGTFQITQIATCAANNVLSHVVVAGGGGAGANAGGGGGAGGFREVKSPATPYTASPLDGYPSSPNRITATISSIPITVGAGGAGSSSQPSKGTNGSATVFSTITSAGGGGGGSGSSTPGNSGGSGGGARANQNASGGSGNTPPTSPAQGTNGGATGGGPICVGGGGGGATAVGNSGDPGNGNGGAGATTSINATPTAFSGGGGGAANAPNAAGSGGTGGGGNGGTNPGQGTVGTANTGGGGGGSGGGASPNGGKAGGSGIVIIRYKFQ